MTGCDSPGTEISFISNVKSAMDDDRLSSMADE